MATCDIVACVAWTLTPKLPPQVPIVFRNDNSVQHLPAGAQSAIFPEDDDMDPGRFAARLLALSPQVLLSPPSISLSDDLTSTDTHYIRTTDMPPDKLAGRQAGRCAIVLGA
jgi:hypothetical protein